MQCPKVSIVTPSFNQGDFIEWTIRSVLCQDYPNIEYIVMDAVSPDRTREVLERYADAIDVLVIEKDAGQSDAINKGFQHATGDILAYLNSDDCLAGPQVVSQAVAAFAAHPDQDVISGRRLTIDAQGHYAFSLPFRPFDAAILREACYIPQEATFWRRSIYERSGGYVDTSFFFAMDYELWLRFLQHGARFLTVPHIWGLFRHQPEQKSQQYWQTHGIGEAQAVQVKYTGRAFSEAEMIDRWFRYFYGTDRERQPEAFDTIYAVNTLFMGLAREQFAGRRVDGWVSAAAVPLPRLGRNRRRPTRPFGRARTNLLATALSPARHLMRRAGRTLTPLRRFLHLRRQEAAPAIDSAPIAAPRAAVPEVLDAAVKTFAECCQAGKVTTVLDVGANTGQFACALRSAGYGKRIVSVEPLSAAHSRLCRLAVGHAMWVVAPRAALGAAPGEVQIHVANNSYSSSILPMLDRHLSWAPDSYYRATETCRVYTLDDYLAEAGPCSGWLGLKIDTQGYELHVLRGASRTLRRVRVLLLEISLEPLYEGAPSFETILALVRGHGFGCVGLYPEPPDPTTQEILQVNGLFIKLD